jgi:hypothetical protein
LANSEAPKFRLTHHPSKGTEAWSNPCENLGIVGGEIGSPTVSGGFVRQCVWYDTTRTLLFSGFAEKLHKIMFLLTFLPQQTRDAVYPNRGRGV